MPNDKSSPEPETVAQQETGGDCVSRLVVRLREEIRQLNMVLARKNRELDALHYVWCSGGCDGGVNRFMPGQLTEDVVIAAERNTARLRGWFENHKLREKYKAERDSHNVKCGGTAAQDS